MMPPSPSKGGFGSDLPVFASSMPVANNQPFLDLGEGQRIDLALIRAGRFWMGSPEGERGRNRDEGPQTQTTISLDFWMGQTEVTVGQFARFIQDTGYRTSAEMRGERRTWRSPGFSQNDAHPVVCVSWEDAMAFCDWASRRTGRAVTLPTEAQWEYACRAGTTASRFWGDSEKGSERYANAAEDRSHGGRFSSFMKDPSRMGDGGDKHDKTAPAKSFQANAWGLHDTLGNVWEWCIDWYGDYPARPVADWSGPTVGAERVIRGASWGLYPTHHRCALRGSRAPQESDHEVGFRVAAY
jgi:formylglycine-generating enzyme required for sulfatase activity